MKDGYGKMDGGGISQTSGGAPRSRAGGACEAPPHKDGNILADQFLSWIMHFIPTAELWGITIK